MSECVMRVLKKHNAPRHQDGAMRHAIPPYTPYRTSSRIALSSPAKVSGYIRLAINCRIMRIE